MAKKFGIHHKCSRNYFFQRKNRARHKLRTYRLNVPQEATIIHELFSIHPAITRSSRVPRNDRIESLMGGNSFEICENLRNRLWLLSSAQPPSATTTIEATRQSSITDNQTSQVSTLLTSQQGQTTAAAISELSTLPEIDYDDLNLSADEEDFLIGATESSSSTYPPQKKRAKNTVIVDLVNNINIGKSFKKKFSNLTSYQSVQQSADEVLAYLIWFCGYNGEFQSIAKNEAMMTDILLLMSEIKAQAISCFKLSPESLTGDFDFNANDINMSNNNDREFDEKKVQDIETFLGRICPTLSILKHRINFQI